MADLNKFGDEINSFRNGTLLYTYSYNSVGNLFFKQESDVFNQQFLKLSLNNLEYKDDKLAILYPLAFEEFVDVTPTNNTPDTQNDDSQLTIQMLENTITNLQYKVTETNNAVDEINRLESQLNATRELIIQLRIDRGEGQSKSDFNVEFPYTPKTF